MNFRLTSATATPTADRLPATAMVMKGSDPSWNVTGPYQMPSERALITASFADWSSPLSVLFRPIRDTNRRSLPAASTRLRLIRQEPGEAGPRRPDVQAQVAYWYGAAGSNTKSCDDLRDLLGKKYADLVDTVRYGNCGNAEFLNAIYLWKTPEANCHDDRGDVCMDYSVWQQKWTEIRGA